MAKHVIVVCFDNTDPAAYGPWDTYAEAAAALGDLRERLASKDCDDVTSVDIVLLREPAAVVGRAVGQVVERAFPFGYRSEDREP